jgi:hypothetical protein
VTTGSAAVRARCQGVSGDVEPDRRSETGGTTLGQMQAEDYRTDGVRVLITGATSGLGAAMAAALLDAGAPSSRSPAEIQHLLGSAPARLRL